MIAPGPPPRFRRSRFKAPDHSREFLIVRWIQTVLLGVLSGASFLLALVSYRMVRTHFVEIIGNRAYFLPAAALALGIYLLLRFFLFWRQFRQERRGFDADDQNED